MNARRFIFSCIAASLLATNAGDALAAEGYFLIGEGARQKALAGATTADSKDAMSIAVNPAGIIGLPRQTQAAITGIFADRGYEAVGRPVVVAPGDNRSGWPYFPVPNSAYSSPIDAESAWGFASWGNGGINTNYDWGHFKPPVFGPTVFGFTPLVSPTLGGPFGGGAAGLDIQQEFVSVAYAHKLGPISIGFAPTFAAQRFNLHGLRPFIPLSSDPYHVTDAGYDYSFGGGIRAGLEWSVTPQLRVAFAGSTPMYMSSLTKYRGLLADGGKFDVPANIRAGVAYDVLPTLTLMADWRHIFYSGIASLANPGFPVFPGTLGRPNGPGFDWQDTDAAGFGAEWRATPILTLRAGYRYSSAAIKDKGAGFAVIAPAVNAHHVSGGLQYQATKNSSFDFAVVYAFRNSINYFENVPYTVVVYPFATFPQAPHYNLASNVKTWGSGLELTVGWNYKFDAGDSAWFPTKF